MRPNYRGYPFRVRDPPAAIFTVIKSTQSAQANIGHE
jgi:hypothetical protein